MAAGATAQPDNRAPEKSAPTASLALRSGDQSISHTCQLAPKFGKRDTICYGARSNDDVQRTHPRQNLQARDLSQPPFQPIARHRGLAIPRHDEANPPPPPPLPPWMAKRGSDPPKLEAVGTDTLPLARYSLHLRAPRQSMRTREPPTLRRPRTSTEAERSTASDPSSDADSIPHAPTASTSAPKIRACESGACSEDDTLACPCPYSNSCSIRSKQNLKAIHHTGTGQRRWSCLASRIARLLSTRLSIFIGLTFPHAESSFASPSESYPA